MQIRSGNTIVEALLAIGIASIVVTTVGSLIIAVNRVDRTSAHKDQAVSYAREALEIVSLIASDEFSSTTGCTPQAGYTSCWVQCPQNVCAASYQIATSGSTWTLTSGEQNLGTNPTFTRSITIAAVGGDENVKRVTVDVSWTERSQPKTVTQETIVTGWQDNPSAP